MTGRCNIHIAAMVCMLVYASSACAQATATNGLHKTIFLSYGQSFTQNRNHVTQLDVSLIPVFRFYDPYADNTISYIDAISELEGAPVTFSYTNYPAIGIEFWDKRTGFLVTGVSFQLGYTAFETSQQATYTFNNTWNNDPRTVRTGLALHGSELYAIMQVMIGAEWGRSTFFINFGFKSGFAKRFNTNLVINDPKQQYYLEKPADNPQHFARAGFGVAGGGEYRLQITDRFFVGAAYLINGVTINRTQESILHLPTVYAIAQQTISLKAGYWF